MKVKILLLGLFLFLKSCIGQIPSFGGCPDYQAMTGFDKTRFLGKWYETERYFTVSELASRCVSATYEIRPDGNIWVNNAITNRL